MVPAIFFHDNLLGCIVTLVDMYVLVPVRLLICLTFDRRGERAIDHLSSKPKSIQPSTYDNALPIA